MKRGAILEGPNAQ